MKERQPIQFKPGVNRTGSEAEMAGSWYDAHLVRWIEGVLRPIAGWEKIILTGAVPASKIRRTHVWTDNNGIQRTALLCEGHLYVLEGNTLIDVSPTPPISPPAADLTIGGYGDNAYGDYPDATPNPYGTARPQKTSARVIGTAYSLDNFGEDLLAMVSSDGRLLRWKPSAAAGTKAAAVPNAPIARCFVVTPERHVMAFQIYIAGDPIDEGGFATYGWSDQEDIENWVFTDVTSMAGRYNIEPAAPIIAAIATRFGVLLFTPVGAYLSRYLGLPYVYSNQFIGRYAAPITHQAIVRATDAVVWPSTDGFWTFNGSTISPLPCPLLDTFQRQWNPRYLTQRASGMYNGMQSEVWWFWPSGDASENDRYLIWNYEEQWWAPGKLNRTCGSPGSTVNYPIMSDGQQLFRHEYGNYYYDAVELPWAQTGAINISSGARQSTVTKGFADTRAPAGDVVFYVGAHKTRIMNGTPPNRLKGPFDIREDGKVDLRVTGRDLVIRIQSMRSGVEPWTFGQMLLRLAPRGQR